MYGAARRMCDYIDYDFWEKYSSRSGTDRDGKGKLGSGTEANLAQMPAGYTKTPAYQAELSSSLGPTLIRFYTTLNVLMLDVMTEEEVKAAYDQSSHEVGPRSYADMALTVTNLDPIRNRFAVPESTREQLELVNKLGPDIFPSW